MDMQKFCDKRVLSGYGSALLYKEANESLYHLLVPLETVPTVFGSVDTFEYDLLTCKTKGNVEGKETLDQQDVEFMWHRDNVRRLEALQGRMLDFMLVYGDFSARTFSGTIRVRPNESTADVLTGTFTITPSSASTTTLLDCRDLIQDTITFTNQIPDSVVIGGTATELEVATDPSGSTTTIAATCDNENFQVSVTQASGTANAKVSISKTTSSPADAPQYGLVEITATADGYASWTTTVLVEY